MTLRDWAAPFLAMATSDLAAAKGCCSITYCTPTFAMLLQMTFEKLGKAAFARRTPLSAGNTTPPHNHQTASTLLRLLRLSPGGTSLAPSNDVSLAVVALESAQPALAKAKPNELPPTLQAPQLEFPWLDTDTGKVMSPAQDLAIVRRLSDPKDRISALLLKFATGLLENFDTAFPPHTP